MKDYLGCLFMLVILLLSMTINNNFDFEKEHKISPSAFQC